MLALCIGQRHEFDVDVGLTFGGVVQVQHALSLTRLPCHGHGAALARLVTWALEVVGYLMAGAADDGRTGAELAAVGRVGRQDPIARVDQDVRTGHAFQVRNQFRRGRDMLAP